MKMKKVLSVFLIAILSISVFPAVIFADVNIDTSAKTVLLISDAAQTSSQVTSSDVPADESVTWSVNIQKAGYYRISLLGKPQEDAKAAFDVDEIGTYNITQRAIYSYTNICCVNLTEGIHTFVLKGTENTLNVTGLKIISVDIEANPSEIVSFEAEDYYVTNTGYAHNGGQATYNMQKPCVNSGAVYLAEEKYVTYRITVSENSMYKISAFASQNETGEGITLSLLCGERLEGEVYVEKTDSFSVGAKYDFSPILLKKGINEITVKNCSEKGARLFFFELEKSDLPIGTTLVNKEVTELPLDKALSRNEYVTDEVIQAGGYVTFSLNFEKSGNYKAAIHGTFASDTNVNMYVGDELHGTKTPRSFDIYCSFNTVYFEAGLYEIGFEVSGGNITPSAIELICVDHVLNEHSVNLIEAENYLSSDTFYYHNDGQYSYDALSPYKNEGAVYLPQDKYAEYSINVPESGLYTLNAVFTQNEADTLDIQLLCDDALQETLSVPNTSSISTTTTCTLDNLKLKAGLHTLKFLRTSETGGLRLFCFELEKTETAIKIFDVKANGIVLDDGGQTEKSCDNFTVSFSKDILPSEKNLSSLKDSEGNELSVKETAINNILYIDLGETLKAGADYTLTVSGVSDINGNFVCDDYKLAFSASDTFEAASYIKLSDVTCDGTNITINGNLLSSRGIGLSGRNTVLYSQSGTQIAEAVSVGDGWFEYEIAVPQDTVTGKLTYYVDGEGVFSQEKAEVLYITNTLAEQDTETILSSLRAVETQRNFTSFLLLNQGKLGISATSDMQKVPAEALYPRFTSFLYDDLYSFICDYYKYLYEEMLKLATDSTSLEEILDSSSMCDILGIDKTLSDLITTDRTEYLESILSCSYTDANDLVEKINALSLEFLGESSSASDMSLKQTSINSDICGTIEIPLEFESGADNVTRIKYVVSSVEEIFESISFSPTNECEYAIYRDGENVVLDVCFNEKASNISNVGKLLLGHLLSEKEFDITVSGEIFYSLSETSEKVAQVNLCSFPVKITPKTLSKTQKNTISALSLDRTYSDLLYSKGGEIFLSPGEKAAFTLRSDGEELYKLSVSGRYTDNGAEFFIEGISGEKIGNTLRFEAAEISEGIYHLEDGVTTFYISAVNGEIAVSGLYLECVSIECDTSAVFEAHRYYENENSSWNTEDSYKNTWSYCDGEKIYGPVLMKSGNFIKYKINAVNSGVYSLNIFAAAGEQIREFTLSENDAVIAKAQLSERETESENADKAVFNKIYLEEGFHELTLGLSDGNSGSAKVYLITIEYDETVQNISLDAESPTVLEYADGMNLTSGSETYLNITNSGAGANILLEYEADENVHISLYDGAEDIGNLSAAKTNSGKAKALLGYLPPSGDISVLKIQTEEPITLHSVTFVPITEEMSDNFISLINGSDDINSFKAVLESYKTQTMLDEDIITGGVIFKDAVLKRIVISEKESYAEFIRVCTEALSYEIENPKIVMYSNGLTVDSLKSGDMTIEVNGETVAENALVVGAIYKNNRLYMICSDNNKNGKIIFEYKDIELSEVDECEFKLLHLDSFENIVPYNPISEVYKNIYVSPEGSDDIGDGSKESPYMTVQKAIDEAEKISSEQWGDIVINICAGTHYIDETLLLDGAVGGKNGFNLVLKGEDGTVISGGRKLSDWEQYNENILVCDLPDVSYVRNLYIDGGRAKRAASEEVYEIAEIYSDSNVTYEKDGLSVLSSQVSAEFAYPEDLELVYEREWEVHRFLVEDIFSNGAYVTFELGRKPLNSTSNVMTGKTFYLENAMELLDSPGEFFFDSRQKKLYYYPNPYDTMEDCYIGLTEGLVKITGTSSSKVSNVVFDNISFRHGANDYISKYGYNGGQSDAMTSNNASSGERASKAQFEIDYADNITIRNCEFTCLGSSAIALGDSVSNAEITHNDIYDISGTAVRIGSPDHSERIGDAEVCSDILVSDNIIDRTSREMFNNCAISTYYEKNVIIDHNTITNTPYTAISAGWGWESGRPYNGGGLYITSNYIDNPMNRLHDGGGIYTLGDLCGAVVSHNYIEDSKDRALYHDAGSANVETFKNVCVNPEYYLQIQNVKYNTHDINVYDIYTNVTACYSYGESDSIFAAEPIVLSEDETLWPQEALDIKAAAGARRK